MAFPVYLGDGYASRYSLLGAMARELGAAFAEKGCPVNPAEAVGTRPGIFAWFNSPPSIDAIPDAARDPANGVALVQIFVDHPYAVDERIIDALAPLPQYRLLMPCVDSVHLLRARWPGLSVAYLPHAVGPGSLCETVENDRETGIVVAGSIHAEHDLAQMEASLPDSLRRPALEMVELMVAHPSMPIEQAMDLSMGVRSTAAASWGVAAAMWRLVSAWVNRRRRIALVTALQGLPVEVWGLDPWREVCEGTLTHRGAFEYEESGRVFGGAKACLAWGPTQFQHSYSERQLLSMAAGCATVSDNRLLVRGQLSEGLEVFDAAAPSDAADLFRDLLRDDARRLGLARRGRALVERSHLWSHRVERIASIASGAIAAARDASGSTPHAAHAVA